MVKLIGVAGSLRSGSFNAALLRAAAELLPSGVELAVGDIRPIPLYDGDIEAREGVPPAVTALKELIASGDGLIISTPEYNNSVPGVLKNAIDWLSRPPGDIPRVFGGRPVALMGASPGAFGTILAHNAWLPILRTLGTEPWFGTRLLVPRAGAAFDGGEIKDEETRARLRDFLEGFAGFVRAHRRAD